MNPEGLDIGILGPAFLAGLIVLSTHVFLGHEVLRRKIIFIDLAIAQIAGLGIILAYSLGWEEQGPTAQVAAVVFALLGAWLLSAVEKRAGEHQEAIIGASFIMAATAGILLLAHNPHGGEHLREMLVGQILWVSGMQLVVAGAVSLAVIAGWLLLRGSSTSIVFYMLFAVAITVSVQLVGVYLVFASLIMPSLATANLAAPRRRYATALLLGALGYLLGLLLSALFDLPSGAVIVWSLALTALAFALLRTPTG